MCVLTNDKSKRENAYSMRIYTLFSYKIILFVFLYAKYFLYWTMYIEYIQIQRGHIHNTYFYIFSSILFILLRFLYPPCIKVASTADVGWTRFFFLKTKKWEKNQRHFFFANDYVDWPSVSASCNKINVKQWFERIAWAWTMNAVRFVRIMSLAKKEVPNHLS